MGSKDILIKTRVIFPSKMSVPRPSELVLSGNYELFCVTGTEMSFKLRVLLRVLRPP